MNLVGQDVPLALPFDLVLEGDSAQATGATLFDRRDFGIGPTYGDESTVGFGVGVRFELIATQGDDPA